MSRDAPYVEEDTGAEGNANSVPSSSRAHVGHGAGVCVNQLEKVLGAQSGKKDNGNAQDEEDAVGTAKSGGATAVSTPEIITPSKLLSLSNGILSMCYHAMDATSLMKMACTCKSVLREVHKGELWAPHTLVEALPHRAPHVPFFTKSTVEALLKLVRNNRTHWHREQQVIGEQAGWILATKAHHFGLAEVMNQFLPLCLQQELVDADSQTFDNERFEQEWRNFNKLMSTLITELDIDIRPFAFKILVVAEPRLTDPDIERRREGHRIIAELTEAAGPATMLTAIRPDIAHEHSDVRNMSAHVLSIVAETVGVKSLLRFLKAVCQCKRESSLAPFVGIRVVRHIAVSMGSVFTPVITPDVHDCICEECFKQDLPAYESDLTRPWVYEEKERKEVVESLVEIVSGSLEVEDRPVCCLGWPHLMLHQSANTTLKALAAVP